MSSVIRKLEIYHLSSIGCPNTIALYNWIEETFTGLTVVPQKNGNTLYCKKNFKYIFIDDRVYDRILVDYTNVYHILMIRFNVDNMIISSIVNYFLMKYSFISKEHIVKFCEISTYLAESKFYE